MIAIAIIIAIVLFAMGAFYKSSVALWASLIVAAGGYVFLFIRKPKLSDWVCSRWFGEFVIGGGAPILIIYAFIFGRWIECLLLLLLIWLTTAKAR
jgi:hypothetical protein